MSNVTSLTARLDDWRLVKSFCSDVDGCAVEVWGNYRKNSHEIRIKYPDCRCPILGLMDIAQLQDAIEDYENR